MAVLCLMGTAPRQAEASAPEIGREAEMQGQAAPEGGAQTSPESAAMCEDGDLWIFVPRLWELVLPPSGSVYQVESLGLWRTMLEFGQANRAKYTRSTIETTVCYQPFIGNYVGSGAINSPAFVILTSCPDQRQSNSECVSLEVENGSPVKKEGAPRWVLPPECEQTDYPVPVMAGAALSWATNNGGMWTETLDGSPLPRALQWGDATRVWGGFGGAVFHACVLSAEDPPGLQLAIGEIVDQDLVLMSYSFPGMAWDRSITYEFEGETIKLRSDRLDWGVAKTQAIAELIASFADTPETQANLVTMINVCEEFELEQRPVDTWIVVSGCTELINGESRWHPATWRSSHGYPIEFLKAVPTAVSVSSASASANIPGIAWALLGTLLVLGSLTVVARRRR